MKNKFLFLILFLFSIEAMTQEYTINGTVSGLQESEVYLMRITGDKRAVIDTTTTDQTGSFEFIMNTSYPVGQYAIIPGRGQLIELLYNKENIRFVTTGNSGEDQVQIIESIENLIYYDYLSIKGMNLYKLDLLYPILDYYPKNDDYYVTTLEKVKSLQNQLNDRTQKLMENNPGTLSARVISVDKPVFPDPDLTRLQQNQYLKSHYFQDSDFLDTLLLNTNILTGKIIGYLTLYQNKEMDQIELEEQLIIAVDTILEKAYVDQQVYEFVVNFLIGGFEAIGFEKGLEHIANHNLVSELCVNSERKKALENKIELIKKLAIGQPAPMFDYTDEFGNSIVLDQINAEKIVIAFWASWCPHCDEILPILKKYYDPNNPEKLEIIGISVDENETDWKKAIIEYGYNWINIAELEGWQGPIIEEYGIVATPTFFVLDKDKKIIGKPANEREFEALLSN